MVSADAPLYVYENNLTFPVGTDLRFDTSANGGTPATVYVGGSALAGSTIRVGRDGLLPDVYGDTATVYVRQMALYPPNTVLLGVLATLTGTSMTYTPSNPGGGTVDKAAVIATGVTAADIGGLTPAAAATSFALGVVSVKPSGDTTGATDTAAINAALSAVGTAGGGRVQLGGVGAPVMYYGNGALVVPSNTTLLLADCTYRLVDGTTDNLVRNSSQTIGGGNVGVTIMGHGRAILDGNAANQTRGALPASGIGILMQNVNRLTVRDVIVGPTCYMASMNYGVVNGLFDNVYVNQDVSTANQDGIDFGPGCHDILVRGTRGRTGDDCFSIFAKNTGSNTTAYTNAMTAAQRNVYNITIVDTIVNCGINPYRLQAGDGSTLKGLRLHNFTNTRDTAASVTGVPCGAVAFGSTNYITTVPAAADLSDIMIDGYTGACSYLVNCESNFSNVTVRNANIKIGSGTVLAIIGYRGQVPSFQPSISGLVVTGVTSSVAVGDMVNLPAGTNAATVELSRVTVPSASSINKSACAISGLKLDRIDIGTATGVLFQQTATSTGSASNVTVGSYGSGVTPYASPSGSPLGLRMGPGMPTCTGSDTTPLPMLGSLMVCDSTKNPTGDAVTGAGYYIGAGSTWNRLASLAGDTTAPTVPTNFTVTSGAAKNTLAWTASTDNVAVTGYRIRRGGSVIATTASTTYVDSGLTAGTAYSYTVAAYDAAGNESAQTSAVSGTPTAATGFVTDSFTDTSGTLLTAHTGETGATWTANGGAGGAAAVISNANRLRNSGGATGYWRASGTPANGNYTVEADFVTLSHITGATLGIIGRAVDGNNFYGARYRESTTAWELYKNVGGTQTVLDSVVTVPVANQVDHIKLVMTGSSIQLVINGTARTAITDTSLTTAGLSGLSVTGSATTDTTGIHLDNFSAA